MNKNLKTIIFFFLLLAIVIYSLFLIETLNIYQNEKNLSADEKIMINEVMQLVELNYQTLGDDDTQNKIIKHLHHYDLTVLDAKQNVLFSSYQDFDDIKAIDLFNQVNEEDALIYPLSINQTIAGHLIFYPTSENHQTNLLFFAMTGLLLSFILLMYIYIKILNKKILLPFENLKGYVKDIAKGHLDIPLAVNQSGYFGEFIWGFDFMREELKKAKQKELETSKEKKEMIARLSHDIKTPIASIKACVEILETNPNHEKKTKYIHTIGKKAEEINHLMTDLFTSAITDLHHLSFVIDEYYSQPLMGEIIESLQLEYGDKIKILNDIPSLLLKTDALRLSQVIQNIIQNSIKYAPVSNIEVSFEKDEQYLICTFRDYGEGVLVKEIPFLLKQFYRGENAHHLKTTGAGLGLYIAQYIMENTDGFITCNNHEDKGFVVKIGILIS